MSRTSKSAKIEQCFGRPVIPVIGEFADHIDILASASSVILQGIRVVDLPHLAELLNTPPLQHLQVFVHLDLVNGLENNEAGLDYLKGLPNIAGIVTVHHHLISPAKREGLLTILRIFLSDSRALERGLKIARASRPDVIDILPVAAAIAVTEELDALKIPRIAGGLCRTEEDIRAALMAGNLAITSTSPDLWKLNNALP